MIYSQYDVVAVPFPFTDRLQSKIRPALVISSSESFNDKISMLVLAMITSSGKTSWPLDTEITYPSRAGLKKNCFVRMKIFTLDAGLVLNRVGKLDEFDIRKVKKSLQALLVA